MRRGLLLVVSSPSGAGKTSLTKTLVEEFPDLALSVSATTRPARAAEADGEAYAFITQDDFNAKVAAGAFLEWAEVHEHRYGTPREPVMAAIAEGRDVLFDIDWQGAEAIAAEAPHDTVRVFILPPSMAALMDRLHTRAQDAADVIQRRLGRAKGEIAHWVDYDYVIVNDDFARAQAQLRAIYCSERLRRARNPWLDAFVQTLLDEVI